MADILKHSNYLIQLEKTLKTLNRNLERNRKDNKEVGNRSIGAEIKHLQSAISSAASNLSSVKDFFNNFEVNESKLRVKYITEAGEEIRETEFEARKRLEDMLMSSIKTLKKGGGQLTAQEEMQRSHLEQQKQIGALTKDQETELKNLEQRKKNERKFEEAVKIFAEGTKKSDAEIRELSDRIALLDDELSTSSGISKELSETLSEKRESEERQVREFQRHTAVRAASSVGRHTQRIVNSKGGQEVVSNMGDALGDMAQGIGDMFGPKGKIVGAIVGAAIKGAAAIANIALGMEGQTHKMMATLGLSHSQLAMYQSKTINMTADMARNWGKGLEDIVAAQHNYMDSTGKAILLSEEGLNASFAAEKIGGQDATQLVAGLDMYNMTAKAAADTYYEMYKNATAMGINAQKYTKDLVANLKLANSYAFKDGVRGLMEMSAWAQKMGLDMREITSMAGKIISNGIEGVVKQSAQLQVLGGARAQASNPLAMMYESLNDIASFGERVRRMTDGLGKLNAKTQQLEFSGSDRIILESTAKALGTSSETLITTINTQRRRESIEKQMDTMGLNNVSKSLKETIMNKAQFDERLQKYMVTTNSGHKLSLDQIREGDESLLVSNAEGSTIEDFARNNMSVADKLGNAVSAIKSGFSMFVYNNFGELILKGIDKLSSWLGGKSLLEEAKLNVSKDYVEVSRLNEREKEFETTSIRESTTFGNGISGTSFLKRGGTGKALFSQVFSSTEGGYFHNEGFVNDQRQTVRASNRSNSNVTSANVNNFSPVSSSDMSMSNYSNVMDANEMYHKETMTNIQSMYASAQGSKTSEVKMSGSIYLDTGDSKFDISDYLRKNPGQLKHIAEGVVNFTDKANNGGRGKLLPQASMRSTLA